MKNLKPKFLRSFLMLMTIWLTFSAESQDIHFSQFHETPLYRNPALAGIMKGDIRVQTVFRSQWNSITNGYKTGSLNAEYKLPVTGDDFLTLGLQVLYDKAGTINMTQTHVLPVLNYHKSLSSDHNRYLSLGFMGGWVQRRFDRSKMTTNSQYDGGGDGEQFLENNYSYIDGGAGISFNTSLNDNPANNLVLGAAYHHFNKPKSSFYNNDSVALKPRLVFSADMRMAVGESSTLTIHTEHMKQGTYSSIMAGIMYGVGIGPYTDDPDYTIHGGAFLRWNDAFIPTLKIDYQPFAFALSYDVNISTLKTRSYGRGGFELSLTYTGFLDRYNTSANAVRCPIF